MKHLWMSALLLALTACSTPEPTSRDKSFASAGRQVCLWNGAVHLKTHMMSASLAAGVSATTLATAIETALKKLPRGEAVAAKIEIENSKPVIEVKVYSQGKLYEVEVDGTSGVVIEVEQEDDDDDDEDGDED